jgi:hypothetical protein
VQSKVFYSLNIKEKTNNTEIASRQVAQANALNRLTSLFRLPAVYPLMAQPGGGGVQSNTNVFVSYHHSETNDFLDLSAFALEIGFVWSNEKLVSKIK